jgi:hypothetical protein
LRPSVRYRIRPWVTAHGGAALFYNFFTDVEDLPERRHWVGLRFVGPSWRGFILSSCFRFGYRAFCIIANSDWESVVRARWQIQIKSPAFGIAAADDFYDLTSAEPFEDAGSSVDATFGDRFRFVFGLGKAVT